MELSQIPNYAPHFLTANFLLAYIFSSTRGPKIRAGLDNNISPRGDLGPRADRAVAEGKITQAQLDKLRRLQGAHENGIEGFPFVVGAMCMALIGGVDAQTVNKYGLVYTVARVLYTVVYVQGTTRPVAAVRSVLFWVGNITCIRLLWFAAKALNVGK